MAINGDVTGLRVLVVEDDYWIATELVEMLSHAGAEVICPAHSVGEALAALEPIPHVASLDVQLGSETSFPIADELRRRGIPFIFCTGTANMIPTVHASRPICHKPMTRKLLIDALCQAIGNPR